MKCSQEKTHAKPDPELRTEDHRYGKVRVRVWHGLHPRLSGRGRWGKGEGAPPIVRGSVIRVDVEHLPKTRRRKNKTLWLWWSGPGEPDLELCFRAYLHRFDLEHSYRFVKNTLGWTAPSPTPSCVWRADWSTTCACPGSGPAIPTSSPRRASEGVSSTSSNSSHSGQSTEIRHCGTGTPEGNPPSHELAIQWSKRPLDRVSEV